MVPASDDQSVRGARYALRVVITFALVILFLVGTILLYIVVGDKPFGVQVATALVYTCVVSAYTFLHTNLGPGYKLKDPSVRQALPRLLVMHAAFVVLLVSFQSAMFAAKPHLPPSWLGESGPKHESIYELVLLVTCVLIGALQIVWSRRTLHRSFLASLKDS